MVTDLSEPESLSRIPTGIRGLDSITHGGLLAGGTYLVTGAPGSGKTTLGNQMAFHHVATGGRAAYVTLLAETHSRLLAQVRSLTFFDSTQVGKALIYLSGYQALDQGGTGGLLEFLRQTVRQQEASLLVIDGLPAVEVFAESPLAFRRFLHELHAFSEIVRCTTLVLASHDGEGARPGEALVDGVIDLRKQQVGLREVRALQIEKFRGSAFLTGRHLFEITSAGLVVYPRIEARLTEAPRRVPVRQERLAFGVARLDEMLRGGLLLGSSTMLLGPSGSGKTLLGLHFLAHGAQLGEAGLYFGFYETPARLMTKADGIGLAMSQHVQAGRIQICWQPPVEQLLDALAEHLLAVVEERQVRRLFIDGLSGFMAAAAFPQRIGSFFTVLINELRARNVTTLLSAETQHLFGPEIEVPPGGGAALAENIILLRYVELRSQLYRLISILKVRESEYDTEIREFRISNEGIDVAATFESAEAILTGVAQPRRGEPSSSDVEPNQNGPSGGRP